MYDLMSKDIAINAEVVPTYLARVPTALADAFRTFLLDRVALSFAFVHCGITAL